MTPGDNLAQYLKDKLFKVFADNRKILEYDWERNKKAYDMTEDNLRQDRGVGKKESKKDKKEWRSRSVSDLTRIKTNAGRILVCDVLLSKSGNIPFKLKEQKISNSLPDEILNEYFASQEMPMPEMPVPENTEPVPQEEVQQEQEMLPQEELQTDPSSPLAEKIPAMTNEVDSLSLMNQLLNEQLVQSKADQALKQCVKDAAIYGEGITRIFTGKNKKSVFKQTPEGWEERTLETDCLRTRPVSIWDFFTDLEDHDIQNNLGVFERRIMSYQDVLQNFSKDDELNIPGAIRSLAHHIREEESNSSSIRDNESPHIRDINQRKKNLEVLEFFGRVPYRYVQSLVQEEDFNDFPQYEDVEIMAVVVESTLVRFAVSEPGMRPFVRIAWEDPSDDLRGSGVADACSSAQQSLDSIIRLIEDNKKLTCNATFAKKSIFFANQHDNEGFYPGKEIEIDASCDDVRKAIQQIIFQDVGQSGFDLVNLYRESGNEASMIPEIAHGISPSSATTAYEISIRNEKAGKYISDVVRGIDDHWIEPMTLFFYRWNMYNPDVPDYFKGAFDVEPMGFSSYNDRVLRMNTLKEILSICLNNQILAQSVNVQSLLAEWMKSNDLDPEEFILPDQATQLNESMQMIQEKFQQIDQTLAELMQNLPAIAERSELDAAEQQAKIEKIKADTAKVLESIDIEKEKERTKRAGMIADLEQKREQSHARQQESHNDAE